MNSRVPQGTLLRFSTNHHPASQRVPFWIEAFARHLVHLEIELKSDDPLHAAADMLALPELRIMWCDTITPAAWKRTADLLQDGDSDFAFLMSIEGDALRTQLGKELEMRSGDGVGIVQNETASLEFNKLAHVAIMVPRSALSPLVPNVEEAALRVISRDKPALRLLQAYLAALRKESSIANFSLRRTVANNIRDLLAAVVGTTRDGKELVMPGTRAARLEIMKAAICENPGLEISELARRHHVTTRSVQLLFEEDGTTFTNYILEQRLIRAHAILTDPSYKERTIAIIAFQVGFGDISYFNRRFKSRFGATPSQIREAALRIR